MKQIKRFFLSILLLAFTGTCLAVPAGVNWQWANPTPQGNPFNAVAHNPLGFTVAVGDLGNIAASSDGGVNWSVQTSNTSKNLHAIYTDADTAFIAVGDGGTIISEGMAGSPPQLTGAWVDFTDGSITANLNGIVKRNVVGSDLFVVVGDNGTVLTNDGSSNVWTLVPVPDGIGNLTAVVWNGTIFVAVSDNGTIIASPNGTSWTKENFTAGGLLAPNGFRAVTWDSTNNQFVAVGVSGIVETSTNGANWNLQTSPGAVTLTGIAQQGATLVAVGKFGSIETSTNGGASWTEKFLGADLQGVASDASQFLVAGNGGQILSGNDGINWTQRLPQSSITENLGNERIEDVIWNGSQFLAVGLLSDSSGSKTLISSDGVSWVAHNSATGAPNDVVWNGSQYIGVGNNFVYTSDDGASWSVSTVAASISLTDIYFDGTQYVAVGTGGIIYTSTDTLAWALQPSGTSNSFSAVTGNGTVLVAVGDNASFKISSDGGANWVTPTLPAIGSSSFSNVIWNGSQFVSVGDNGTVLTSADGNSWVSQVSGANGRLRGINWDGSQFTAVSGLGEIITSPDAVTWTTQATITTNVLTAVAGSETKLVAVGWDGTILSSAGTVNTTNTGNGGGGGSLNLYLLMLLSSLVILIRKK